MHSLHSLTGPDQSGIGYQYRSPPEQLKCSANITVTRLDCWVALPSTPLSTKVEVRWYWRSLVDADEGSITAFQVYNSFPFLSVDIPCNRVEVCPTAL